MNSMRKIFTGLDFGGRRIKDAKIDGQPYYIPFNFNDANKDNPVPQEVIKTIASMFSSTIGTNELPIFYLYFGEVPIPQASVLEQCDIEGDVINTIILISLADEIDITNSSIVKSVKQLMINGTNGSWELEDLPFSSGTSFYTLDLIHYTVDIFNELSAMTLGTTIQVIDISGRPILCQLADIELDYIILNSYMQYDDSDEDPHIIAYTLNADGTLRDPIERIVLETTGGGTKFLSDDGTYKELNLDNSAGIYDIQLSDFTSAEDFTNLLAARQEGKIIRINGIIVDYVTVGDNVIIFQSPATLDITRNVNIVKYSVRVSTYRFNPDGTYSITYAKTPVDGDGTKFLSDDGTYKEVKTSDLTNTKVTQEEYNALEAAGTLDANTIYYIIG